LPQKCDNSKAGCNVILAPNDAHCFSLYTGMLRSVLPKGGVTPFLWQDC